jgi:hypothetical protein
MIIEASPPIACSFEDLACRFERPDARNRWDSPLFTIDPAQEAARQQQQQEQQHQGTGGEALGN